MELEEGDKVVEERGGTFLVNIKGHCFKSRSCRLDDYVEGTKVKADYLGNLEIFQQRGNLSEGLAWKEYKPKKPTSKKN